jgi:GNAT superfamily N-acetyltransferase
MAARRADVLAKGLPYLVAEEDGRVLGFAYCQWFKPRPAYRFSAEDSIYLHPERRRQGAGQAAAGELAQQAEAAGVRKLIAVIGDSANAGSIGVHRAQGFTPRGHHRVLRLEVRPLAGHRADGKGPRRRRRTRPKAPHEKQDYLAAWLAFVGGPFGLHRFYLHGPGDWLGWLLPVPTLLGAYGVLRMRSLGQDDGAQLGADPAAGLHLRRLLPHGHRLRPEEAGEWNAASTRRNPADAAGQTGWATIWADRAVADGRRRRPDGQHRHSASRPTSSTRSKKAEKSRNRRRA